MRKPLRLALKLTTLLAIAVIIAYGAWIAARVAWWIDHNPQTTAFMQDRLQALQEKNARATISHYWLAYKRISPQLKHAVVAAEDARFVQHNGFDWGGIQTALEKDIKQGRIVAGGSTISQQLAKNLFLSRSRTPWRKAQEAYITVLLETLMDKRRILEIYLNTIEWGEDVFGAEAAARHYFGVSAAVLNAEQAAQLAAMIPNPSYYDQRGETTYLASRSTAILAYMDSTAIPR
jgi:monofunctional biosynthetic peptidoglycan transglycosylase